jgi:NADPH-dependent curcumin reductase
MNLNRRGFTLASLTALSAIALYPVQAAARPVNRRIVLASRPNGTPITDNFRLETLPLPQPADGEVLLQTRFLSLDPYMRGRMNAGKSYAPGVELGEVMVGGTVSAVVSSRNPALAKGDLVTAYAGWQDYALSDGSGLMKLDPRITQPSWALGVLGMPGLTAYVGLLDSGEPKAGETVVAGGGHWRGGVCGRPDCQTRGLSRGRHRRF